MSKNLIKTGILTTVIATLALSAAGCSKHLATAPGTKIEKISYIIGYSMGNSFKAQDVNVDSKYLMQGLQDGYSGTHPAIAKQDMQKIMQNFQQQLRTKIMQKYKQAGIDNQKKSDVFMADIAQKSKQTDAKIKMIQPGLYYEVIKTGTGKVPKANSSVKVNYEGSLINGKVFDSSYKRGKPATFKVIKLSLVGQKYYRKCRLALLGKYILHQN